MNSNNFEYSFPINFCSDVAKISTEFEKANTEVKKEYLIKNIRKITEIMQSISGCRGVFGTGYPFYVLDYNFEGDLPVIDEQIRYNKELIEDAKYSKFDVWTCAKCLEENGYLMEDLKSVCKPCKKMDNELKPRKVINRLPDVDMWMICDDDKVEYAKYMLSKLFIKERMHTSDIDVAGTIRELREITLDLKEGKIPNLYLPLDVHIIEYSKFKKIVEYTPISIINVYYPKELPFMPISPYSLRKVWQKDDEPYNFILDFLFSLTPFDWDKGLMEKLELDYKFIFGPMEYKKVEEMILNIAPPSVKRRYKTGHLYASLVKRMDYWKWK